MTISHICRTLYTIISPIRIWFQPLCDFTIRVIREVTTEAVCRTQFPHFQGETSSPGWIRPPNRPFRGRTTITVALRPPNLAFLWPYMRNYARRPQIRAFLWPYMRNPARQPQIRAFLWPYMRNHARRPQIRAFLWPSDTEMQGNSEQYPNKRVLGTTKKPSGRISSGLREKLWSSATNSGHNVAIRHRNAGKQWTVSKQKAPGNKRKSPQDVCPKGFCIRKWRLPTLPPGMAVPSAMVSLTSLFGMGRGGSSPL